MPGYVDEGLGNHGEGKSEFGYWLERLLLRCLDAQFYDKPIAYWVAV